MAEDQTERPKELDTRDTERLSAEYPIHLMVSLHGFDPSDHRFEAKGMTVNISRGGVLVRVNQPVAVDSRCLVHIPGGESHLGRTLIYGTVLRTVEKADSFEVAIQFDTRLQDVSPEDSLPGS